MTSLSPQGARSLADPLALQARRAMLADAPHLRKLQPLLARMRNLHGFVPDPDPLDGGADASVLILLETPGPRMKATGIVSRDNPAGTAANLFRFLHEAGLPRHETLIWNAVPFLIHATGARNRAPSRAEAEAGLRWLPPLLDLLPHLHSVVCAGRFARNAIPIIERHRSRARTVAVPHPSPTYVCTDPAIPARIVAGFALAGATLDRAA